MRKKSDVPHRSSSLIADWLRKNAGQMLSGTTNFETEPVHRTSSQQNSRLNETDEKFRDATLSLRDKNESFGLPLEQLLDFACNSWSKALPQPNRSPRSL